MPCRCDNLAAVLLACSLAGCRTPAREDLAEGERLYQAQCADCHGPRGEGGRGAFLARPRLVHAPADQALLDVISRGIPGTQMPRSGMSARQVRQVAAYVRSLGRITQPAVSGDPARGEKLYAGKGACAQCHTLAGRGGAIGPDLTGIGARTGAPYLRDALADPEVAVPDGFLQVEAVTKDGRRITGVRVNEDTSSIQMQDLAGNLHSLWKSELAKLDKQWGKSPMPSYRNVLTPTEIDDVVAYLLAGAR